MKHFPIRTMNKGAVVALVSFLPVLLGCAPVFSQQLQWMLVDVHSRDTLFATTATNRADELVFRCPERKQPYDVAVLIGRLPETSFSTIVPLASGTENRYRFDSTGVIPFIGRTAQPVFVHFSGNPYLTAYERLLNAPVRNAKDDSVRAFSALLRLLYRFDRRFPGAQIVGYHLYYMQPQFATLPLSRTDRSRWKHLLQKGSGFFYAALKTGGNRPKEQPCREHDAEQLVFQSANSVVDSSLLKGYVHVVVFWATWCGPCKPLLSHLSELNNNNYAEANVLFHAVTSEDDFRKVITVYNQHPEYNGLGLFHDSNGCMTRAYGVDHYPTILIFDRNGKLVARDPESETIRSIIDQTLATE